MLAINSCAVLLFVLEVVDKVPCWGHEVLWLLPAPSVMAQGRLLCGLVPEPSLISWVQVMVSVYWSVGGSWVLSWALGGL